jgi:hypothetical protein
MSWNGIAVNRPAVPSKDNGSKGGKVSFKENHESGKHIGNKGVCHRGTATKEDSKSALPFVPAKVNKIDHNKPSTYGPAPTKS